MLAHELAHRADLEEVPVHELLLYVADDLGWLRSVDFAVFDSAHLLVLPLAGFSLSDAFDPQSLLLLARMVFLERLKIHNPVVVWGDVSHGFALPRLGLPDTDSAVLVRTGNARGERHPPRLHGHALVFVRDADLVVVGERFHFSLENFFSVEDESALELVGLENPTLRRLSCVFPK